MDSSLRILSGLILTVLAVMANAYWQDAVRWDKVYFKALQCKNDEVLAISKNYIWHAKFIFRVAAFLGALTTTSVIYGIFFDELISKLILVIVLSFITLLLIILAFIPKYKIPIESSYELIKLEANLIQSDNKGTEIQ